MCDEQPGLLLELSGSHRAAAWLPCVLEFYTHMDPGAQYTQPAPQTLGMALPAAILSQAGVELAMSYGQGREVSSGIPRARPGQSAGVCVYVCMCSVLEGFTGRGFLVAPGLG